MIYIRRTLIIIAVLLSYSTVSIAQKHQGIGCWRTATSRQQAASRMAFARKNASDDNSTTAYQGTKKGLVILAEFTDRKFSEGNNLEKYANILNTRDYTSDEGFIASVADYFRDQSAGQFELQFDVVGPYTTEHDYSYYGENDSDGYDLRPEEMIREMCIAADDIVNFPDYDWDGDGFVDEVFVVYAGKSESDGGGNKSIWPHMWTFEEAGIELSLDGVQINVYACSNEIDRSGKIEGIGTFCHEFSHCLGLPDLYDVAGTGQKDIGDYDIMSSGCYSGNGFCPVGYSAYEKMVCGWQSPTPLTDTDMDITDVVPISQHGETFIITNPDNPDEYYTIENRQRTGWDKYYIKTGLLITHIDYDEAIWANNIVNSVLSQKKAEKMGYSVGNDHQRVTAKLVNSPTVTTTMWNNSISKVSTNTDLTMNFFFDADIAAGIGTVLRTDAAANSVYSITGMQLDASKPLPRRGVYIINGRLVVR